MVMRLLRVRLSAQRRLGITAAEFWELTPGELATLDRDWQREFVATNSIALNHTLAFMNMNRKKGSPAIKPEEICPFYEAPKKKEMSGHEMLARARIATAKFGGEIVTKDA